MNHDLQYMNILNDIVNHGAVKTDRTGTGTQSLSGKFMKFEINGHFLPLITTRKLPKLSVPIVEMLWFLSGNTDIGYLKEHGIGIWDSWVKEGTKRFDADGKLIGGSIGSGAYGAQWRFWEDTRLIKQEQIEEFTRRGYKFVTYVEGTGQAVMTRVIDQIARTIETLKTNPDSRRMYVSTWNPAALEDQSLPPCFLEDALVSTPDGYRKISDIQVGDTVYSDTMVPRKVLTVHKTPYNRQKMIGIRSAAANFGLISTPCHPHKVVGRDYLRADEIIEGDRLVLPIQQTTDPKPYSYTYTTGLPKTDRLKVNEVTLTEVDYYNLGYFAGNGWFMENSDNRVCFAIPTKKLDFLLPKIRESIKISVKPGSPYESVSTYETNSKKWAHVLKQFGHGAPNKQIPEWVFTSPRECIQAFYDGLLEADGCHTTEKRKSLVTTSKKLALGFQRLSLILGRRSIVNLHKRKPTHVILGRIVNQRDFYMVSSLDEDGKSSRYFDIANDCATVSVRTIVDFETDDDTFVYNLEVEEEHTYIVNNIATHNCHSAFHVTTHELREQELLNNLYHLEKPHMGFDKEIRDAVHAATMGEYKDALKVYDQYPELPRRGLQLNMMQRSADYPIGAPTNIAQYSFLAHLLASVSGHIATSFGWMGSDVHVYSDQREIFLKEHKHRQAIPCTPTVVFKQRRDNIFDYTSDDFEIQGYESQGPIKYPVAI